MSLSEKYQEKLRDVYKEQDRLAAAFKQSIISEISTLLGDTRYFVPESKTFSIGSDDYWDGEEILILSAKGVFTTGSCEGDETSYLELDEDELIKVLEIVEGKDLQSGLFDELKKLDKTSHM